MTLGARTHQSVRYISVSAISLLYISGGLAFLSRHWIGQADVPTLLLMLYAAVWSYILGIMAVILIPICVLTCQRSNNIPVTSVKMTLPDFHENFLAGPSRPFTIGSKCSEVRKEFSEVA